MNLDSSAICVISILCNKYGTSPNTERWKDQRDKKNDKGVNLKNLKSPKTGFHFPIFLILICQLTRPIPALTLEIKTYQLCGMTLIDPKTQQLHFQEGLDPQLSNPRQLFFLQELLGPDTLFSKLNEILDAARPHSVMQNVRQTPTLITAIQAPKSLGLINAGTDDSEVKVIFPGPGPGLVFVDITILRSSECPK